MSWPRLFAVLCLTLPALLAPLNLHGSQKKTELGDKNPQSKSATIRVLLAGDAVLYIDDYQAKQTGKDRVFETPPLEAGKTFQYTLKAVWKQDGRSITRMAVA